MAFRTPQFPLTCNVWTAVALGGAFAYAAPDRTLACNLSPGRRALSFFPLLSPEALTECVELLLPRRSDIRASWNGSANADSVECPAGTKRFYLVRWVDDVGRGFQNEYRLAVCSFMASGLTFSDVGAVPVPLPLP